MTNTYPLNPNGITTIALSPRIFVQGVFVRETEDGRIVVRVGDKDYIGQPLSLVA